MQSKQINYSMNGNAKKLGSLTQMENVLTNGNLTMKKVNW